MAEQDELENAKYVNNRTDKYFTKSQQIVEKFGDVEVAYGVFMRRDVLAALNPAIEFLTGFYPKSNPIPLQITRLFEEGAFVPDQKPMLAYSGSYAALGPMETLLLREIGVPCVSAINAYQMCTALPAAGFLDMHARHSPGDDMSALAAYGASVGSKQAKMQAAVGFVGTSQDRVARHYGTPCGVGTMPHAIIGYAGSTLKAAQMYVETHPQDNLTVLVDYFGQEITDALEVCDWWYNQYPAELRGHRGIAFRLDTHGGRYAEGLDFTKSVEIVADWIRSPGLSEYGVISAIFGEEAFAMMSNEMKDRLKRHLFGTGVSAANVINMRKKLSRANYHGAKIVASSGFNTFKCKVFGKARVPVDMVGTGSFLPDTMGETYATADIYRYGDNRSVKIGREKIFAGLK